MFVGLFVVALGAGDDKKKDNDKKKGREDRIERVDRDRHHGPMMKETVREHTVTRVITGKQMPVSKRGHDGSIPSGASNAKTIADDGSKAKESKGRVTTVRSGKHRLI